MAQADDFDDALSRGAEGIDRLREAGLRGMEALTVARQASLERERARLAEELGEKDPRVTDVARRIVDGTSRLGALKTEIARAGAVARAGTTEWVLHGYVRSADGAPARDLTVALVNGQGQWLRELGFAGTDARGYFQLRTPAADVPEAFVRVTDRNRAQVHRSEDPVVVTPGRVEYREISLGTDGTRGPVPPEDVAPDEPPPDSEKKSRRRA